MTTRTATRSISGTEPEIDWARAGFAPPSSEATIALNTEAPPPQTTSRRRTDMSRLSIIMTLTSIGLLPSSPGGTRDVTRLAAWLRTRSILSAGQRSSTWILPPSRPSQLCQLLLECANTGFALAITLGERHYDSDAPHPPGLLRARRERPRSRAAEQRHEIATPHGAHPRPG